MLGKWLSHKEYQKNVVSEFSDLARLNPHALLEYQNDIPRVFILNLDLLKPIIEPFYSTTGRPSNLQPEIFRSFILMNSLGYTLDKWLVKLKNNYVLRVLIGGVVPSLGSHYDFINRIYTLDEKPLHKPKKRKPSKKIGKNKKLPNRRSGIVGRLVAGILNDYGIENSKARGKKRISFFTTIAGFNVHLDAQLKFLKSKNLFDFNSTFNIQAVA